MRKNNIISKIIGLLMLVSVFSAHVASASYVPQPQSASSEKDKKEKETPVIQQISHESVVPSYDFSFEEFQLVFDQNFIIGYEQNAPFVKPFFLFFRNSYFDKLFEHHIAINAP
ncbi:hypothetical protein EGI26_20800 [Lacihabitans sp. CCS-44]|uniref:hypothetical protein n=1 Tax=Lacihabitans sp. CCS-44 TaxID=2487331 RepID=UPI0020CEF847|nr:hypothetical protein [Lacihabitans sp. CCS-44]MCP9757609.1 hypothetical protein [Lacihabitans sp. CCS-44]